MPADRQPVDPVVDEAGTTGAYTSTVTITYDRDDPVEDKDPGSGLPCAAAF